MIKFERINSDAKVAYVLGLCEKVINNLSDSKGFEEARDSLNACWEWLEKKEINADDLYWYLENVDDTGVITIMQLEENEDKINSWVCLGDAIAFTVKAAYEYQGETYLPATIEGVDIDTIKELDNNFNKAYNQGESFKCKLLDFLIDNYPKESNKKIKKYDIIQLETEE